MKPLHKMTRKELEKEWIRLTRTRIKPHHPDGDRRTITLVKSLDLTPAMTPEEIEAAEWQFCEDNQHEYAEYKSDLFGRMVCFTCDPESENNRHRPSAIEAVAIQKYRKKFAASGGKAKSPRKAAASRANGKKGGRPRNVTPPPV